jgi:hypothetical protein
VQGTTTLTADASADVGVIRVDFLVDDNVVGSDSTAPYSCDWEGRTGEEPAGDRVVGGQDRGRGSAGCSWWFLS